MPTDILVVGARGLGTEVLGYLEEHGDYRIVAVLDELDRSELLGYPVVHPRDYGGSCRRAVFAVGYPEHKAATLTKYAALDLEWETFVHPRAQVSRHARLGQGCVVAPFAVVSGNPVLGSFVFVNCFAAVGHDAVVGDHASLMPHSALAGGARLGAACLLALGALVLPGVSVGPRSRVSAGAVVTRDAPADCLVFGNPARAVPESRKEIVS